jgi:hypothetical protein
MRLRADRDIHRSRRGMLEKAAKGGKLNAALEFKL